MYFHKYPHPSNFEFIPSVTSKGTFRTRRGRYRLEVEAGGGDVYRLRVTGKGWERNDSLVPLQLPKKSRKGALETTLEITENAGFRLRHSSGLTLLESHPGYFFGQSGPASVFAFRKEPGEQYYGMGEKWMRLEHGKRTTKFWNTDVWADFNPISFIEGQPPSDPAYASIPYLILKRGNAYIGLLVDNPRCTFISTSYFTSVANQLEVAGGSEGCIYLGAEAGQPSLIIIHGPGLADVTRKLQKIVGVTPRPPAWALGNHQCRWGYQSEADLKRLDENFRKHEIPVDGLWLDIDYMNGFRVFTFSEKHFKNPKETFRKLEAAGRKVVPIIDPGVKHERGYPVYERGSERDVFCRNPQGADYIGVVWPGETAFPDFSLAECRKWWAEEVKTFASTGIKGAWLDMNDPSTGISDSTQMLFDRGRQEHDYFHNQYALGMAMASREGFMKAWPEERPFLLCRSGSTGIGQFTALWTGDNFSNHHHLRMSVPVTLNLALSGVPFNGADVGGFGGDANPGLLCQWHKAAFLFPFFRNHSLINTREQEPWAFDKKTLDITRHFIRLRYRLRPYLYQLFIAQELDGEAILRPLIYDFEDTREQPLGLIDDEFLVGPAILQAPFLEQNQTERDVVLPSAWWHDLSAGEWIEGGCTVRVAERPKTTPIYVRDGSIVPLARTGPADNAFRSWEVDFHLFLRGDGVVSSVYRFDDGVGFGYRKGEQSTVRIEAMRSGPSVEIHTTMLEDGYRAGDFVFSCGPGVRKVTVNGVPAKKVTPTGVPLSAAKFSTWQAAGS